MRKYHTPDKEMNFWTEDEMAAFLQRAGEEADERERREMRLKKTVETNATH